MAGKGSKGERGRSPLSNAFPLLNIEYPGTKNKPVREGDKGGEYLK
jgi:hypothetical protein